MSILTFPNLIPNQTEWALVSRTQAFQSPLAGTTQTLELPGSAWRATLTFPPLKAADARTLAAFLVQLRGRAGRFRLHDHSLPAPRGSASGTPLVHGAGQTGATLVTRGWTPSASGVLLAGDYLQVGDELKMVVANANANGSGQASISIEPPLRASHADGATITLTKASCVMMLQDDEQARWATQPGKFSDFSITCIEAIV